MKSLQGRAVAVLTGLIVGIGWAGPLVAEDAKPAPTRIASVRMIMSGIHAPHCGAIGEALKGDGPKDDKAWADVALHAALLNESGHLLVQNNRCPDGIWADAAAKLRDGTAGVFNAAASKDVKAARESFTVVTASCAACHAKHKQPAAQAAAKPAQPIAGAPQSQPAGAPAVRVAQVRHLMSGINGPAVGSLGSALKGEGPKEDKEWSELVKQASLLNEVGFLLMENGRCPDNVWKEACAALRDQSGRVAIAGGSKNLEEARVGFKGITTACGACHSVHKKPPA